MVAVAPSASLAPLTPLFSSPGATSARDASSDLSLEGVAARASHFFNAAINNHSGSEDRDNDIKSNTSHDVVTQTRYPMTKEEYLQLPKKLPNRKLTSEDFALVLDKTEGDFKVGVNIKEKDLGVINLRQLNGSPDIFVELIHPAIRNSSGFIEGLEDLVIMGNLAPNEKKLVSKLMEANMVSQGRPPPKTHGAAGPRAQSNEMKQVLLEPGEIPDPSTAPSTSAPPSAASTSNFSELKTPAENRNRNRERARERDDALPPSSARWLPKKEWLSEIVRQAQILYWRGSSLARQTYSMLKHIIRRDKGGSSGSPPAMEH
jgi:hypothetical protein